MALRHSLRGFFASTIQAGGAFRRWLDRERHRAAIRRPTRPLLLEALEDRTVPTVLFAPNFGNESLLHDGGQRINSPQVFVVLWGSSWGGTYAPDVAQVNDGITGVLLGRGSHYLDGLAQYGVTTNASYRGTIYDNTPDPQSGFTSQALRSEIDKLIANHQLPDPANTPNMVVDMVTAPGITSKNPDYGGFNNASFNGNTLRYGLIWNGTSDPQLSVRDATSIIFSHELAEVMTDPGKKGYEVNPAAWSGSATGNQIGDYEGNGLQYRLGDGTLVQPYWSAGVNTAYPEGWLITDGNVQTMNVNATWFAPTDGTDPYVVNYDVAINGGQLALPNGDYLSIAQQGSGDQPSVLAIVLNNELFQMDSVLGSDLQLIATVTANITSGLVHINGSPVLSSYSGITVNAHRGVEVDVASNKYVLANVTINDASTVSIGPGTESQSTRNVQVSAPHVPTKLILDDRADPNFTPFSVFGAEARWTGFTVDYTASQIQNLVVLGGTGGNLFALGDALHPLDALPANITVTGGVGPNGARSTLLVDGTGSFDTLYVLDKGVVSAYLQARIRSRLANFLTNQIHYSNLASLEVDGGPYGNSFTVNGTDASAVALKTGIGSNLVQVKATTGSLKVNGDGGKDTVKIGANGSVRNIGNTLTVLNPGGSSAVSVDDSADRNPRTVIIYNNGILNGSYIVISGLTPGGDISLHDSDLSSLTVSAGSGGNTFRIHDTPYSATSGGLATTVNTGSGNNRVTVDGTTGDLDLNVQTGTNNIFVGSTSGSLDRIQGVATILGTGGNNVLTYNDSASLVGQEYDLYADHLQRTDTIVGQPDAGLVTFGSMSHIALYGSSAGSIIGVRGVAATTSVDIYGFAGAIDTFVVFPQMGTVLGNVNIHGQTADGDFALYEDSLAPTANTYTFTADATGTTEEVARPGAGLASFSGITLVQLYTSVVGGSVVNVQGVVNASSVSMYLADGDSVVVGSQAPGFGGTLANIQGPVVVSAPSTAAVSLTVDDSGNLDTTPQRVVFLPVLNADGFISMLGLAPGSTSIAWNLSPTSSVKVLGGAANETFVLAPIVAETPLTIVGGSGINTLDYSAYTSGVTVNLATGVATDLAGIANFRNAIGGSGDDVLTGSVLGGVLAGGAGDDILTASGGRNILIGGSGADTLIGGGGGDILIGGLLAYYDEDARVADMVALDALLAEWSRTDLSYQERVNHLSGSVAGGLNDPYVLNDSTVFDDGSVDIIFARAGENWRLDS